MSHYIPLEFAFIKSFSYVLMQWSIELHELLQDEYWAIGDNRRFQQSCKTFQCAWPNLAICGFYLFDSVAKDTISLSFSCNWFVRFSNFSWSAFFSASITSARSTFEIMNTVTLRTWLELPANIKHSFCKLLLQFHAYILSCLMLCHVVYVTILKTTLLCDNGRGTNQ